MGEYQAKSLETKTNYEALFVGYPTCDFQRYVNRIQGVMDGVTRHLWEPESSTQALCVPRPFSDSLHTPENLSREIEQLLAWGYQDPSYVNEWRTEISGLATDHPPERDHIPPKGAKVYLRVSANGINPTSDTSVLETLLLGNGLKLYRRIRE